MARASAMNAVAAAVLTALNVSSVRALCPGGVSRARQRKGAPPYVTIGPHGETPDDALGTGYGAVVTSEIHVITSGEDADGDARALGIVDAIVALLDEPVALSVSGWSVRMVEYAGSVGQVVQFEDGKVGYDYQITMQTSVRKA